MIIRVESGLTLLADGKHYVKESAAIEFDHPDTEKMFSERLPLMGEAPTADDLRSVYKYLSETLCECIWDAIENQLDILEGA